MSTSTMWNMFLLVSSLALLLSSLGSSLTTPSSSQTSDSHTGEGSSRTEDGMDDPSVALISQTKHRGVSEDSSKPMAERTTDTNPPSSCANKICSWKGGVETVNMQRPSSLPSLSPTAREVVEVNAVSEDSGSSGKQNSEESRITTGQISVMINDQDVDRHDTANIDVLQQRIRPPLSNDNVMKEEPAPDPAGLSESILGHQLLSHDGPCGAGLIPCAALTISNGTNLVWEDMRRTLAFAWELHVFGSAGLFALLAGLSVLGVLGASTFVQPLRGSLALANSLLLFTGTQRAVLLLLDPYGTRQILSLPTLAALHNLPLHFLLWAQVVLALVALRGVILRQLARELQGPWVVGVLAALHCALLLTADLLSPVLSRTFPLSLHALSLCCALPSCVGVLGQAFSRLRPSVGPPAPRRGTAPRGENQAVRVVALCGALGLVCCCLQAHSVLWLYGVLGNWRRFSWGWWLSQFWARVAELAWGFVLLALGSWILWTPQKSHVRGDHRPGRLERSDGFENTSFWDRVFVRIRKGQFRQSENNWGGLMPNTWSRYHIHRAGLNNNTVCEEPVSAMTPSHMPRPVTSGSCDSQAALQWQREGEQDCFLSEFDLRPPSPIDLVGSIDCALRHGASSVGRLFKAPPPPLSDPAVDPDVIHGQGTALTPGPGCVAFQWSSDTCYTPGSPDGFQNVARSPPPAGHTDPAPHRAPEGDGTQRRERQNSENTSEWMHQDWSEDDVIDL